MSEKGEKAADMYSRGFNCAAAVFGAFCEDYDLDAEEVRLAGALGGGCCRTGGICGAVSGAALVVGLKYGQTVSEDRSAKMNCSARADEFIEEFKKSSPKGAVLDCRDILGFDLGTPEGRLKIQEVSGDELPCGSIVYCAAETLEKLGY